MQIFSNFSNLPYKLEGPFSDHRGRQGAVVGHTGAVGGHWGPLGPCWGRWPQVYFSPSRIVSKNSKEVINWIPKIYAETNNRNKEYSYHTCKTRIKMSLFLIRYGKSPLWGCILKIFTKSNLKRWFASLLPPKKTYTAHEDRCPLSITEKNVHNRNKKNHVISCFYARTFS